jgi:hypothetical protein
LDCEVIKNPVGDRNRVLRDEHTDTVTPTTVPNLP